MQYAFQNVKDKFPLDETKYNELLPDDLSYIDQLIFRFSKLQDSMGNRLFPALLENLGEDIQGKPFIDLLTTLERLELIDNHKEWLNLRETRNIVTHEYPFNSDEIINGLNVLSKDVIFLSNLWNNLENYAKERFNL
jgi:hypothetical protein